MQQGRFGDLFPRVPGHEAVGDVVAVGDGVRNFRVGERVGGAWHGGKSQCAFKITMVAD
jgi:D-arabinose 1-dehydrogenase-like Zn-dependent alcohol dehydrogenase